MCNATPQHVNALKYFTALFSREKAPNKRRKPENLNSRFDRMIHTVNVIHAPNSEREPKRRRRGSSTSGSSSLTGWETPKTPMNAYSELECGRLGPEFSVAKMKGKPKYDTLEDPELHFFRSNHAEDVEDVPMWLSNTVATLQSNHPLRDLIPASSEAHIPRQTASTQHEDDGSLPGHSVHSPSGHVAADDDIFVFRPPTAQPQLPAPEEQVSFPVSFLVPNVSKSPELDAEDAYLPGFGDAGWSGRFCSPAHSLARPSARSPASLPMDHNLHVSREGTTSYDLISAPPVHPQSAAFYRPLIEEVGGPAAYPLPFSEPGPLARPRGLSATSLSSPIREPLSPVLDLALPTHENIPLPFSIPGPLAPTPAPQNIFAPKSVLAASHTRSSSPSASGIVQHQRSNISAAVYSRPGALSDLSLPPSDPEPLSSPPSRTQNLLQTRHSAAQNSSVPRHPFSTPGPAARIYFDSPAEDPIGSDPLGPEDYELRLDYEELDFRWKRFDRGTPLTTLADHGDHEDQYHVEQINASGSDYPLLSNFERKAASIATTDEDSLAEDCIQDGNVDNAVDLVPGSPAVHEVPERPKAAEDRSHAYASAPTARSECVLKDPRIERPAFAPAPGIYISPLRTSSKGAESADEYSRANVRASSTTEDALDEEHEILEFSLPRTPTRAATGGAVQTTPRKNRAQRSISIPPIAVLPRTPSRESVKDPEPPSLSQVSNDTIESWSAP
ncbi:uncharacterized protein PHACADRAFT_185231 [Phanerochaete carnosa HHB-10118-sp]|uniref:Uncharacterized protein n=1 Tax=Phanerochaete carnosa (strain HHB-10118-sp) TaxID=650164 RepID=K5WUY0_PHACS|nr:uncharacterized protein PHACADRAFT_185231 [Phanerochaete carnosa HHB-10118-sp]EKM54272.1 hypothetical protein PHACADRAFT_185231 [Phanerochaete carnosa HHB-10118-sp]